MENLSHSFSKKSYHHGSRFFTTASKSLYDDVFGGPPKFRVPTLAPRYENYTEIFGGFHSSRASSIPILDLPVVEDEGDQVSFDVQSSHFDYSEIFGGFNVVDFALSYEDLVRQSTSGYDSSQEAWYVHFFVHLKKKEALSCTFWFQFPFSFPILLKKCELVYISTNEHI